MKNEIGIPHEAQRDVSTEEKVVCGCCGSRMHIHPEDYGRVYMCNHRKTYGKDSCACMPVKMEDVYETVFSVLKESMKLFLDENEIIREMNRSEKGRERKQVLTEAVVRHLKEIEKCRELKRGLYQDYLDKLLDEKDYIKFNREYSERIEKLTEEMNELQSAAEKYEKSPAEVVREIFSLAISGKNCNEIARLLNERKEPTRLQNQWKRGIHYVPVHDKGDYLWSNTAVLDILSNEQYTGVLIQNRNETVGFGEYKKMKKCDRSKWSMVPGGVPAIVSGEDGS